MKIYFLLTVLLAFVSSVFSQSTAANQCDFRFDTYPFSAIKEENPILLNGIKVVLKSEKNRKIIKAKDATTHLFTALAEGDYELTASLPAYQTTTQKISISCPQTSSVEPSSQIIFLWKEGETKPKEIDVVTRGVYGAAKEESANSQTGVKKSDNRPLVNGLSRNLVRPKYPAAAVAVRARGAVNVQVTINELGFVISAVAVDGHPLLRSAAEKAALESKFTTTLLEGMPVKVTGIIVYNFDEK